MQVFTSKSDQNCPTWAQLGPKLGSSWAQKSIKNRFKKDFDKEAPLQIFKIVKFSTSWAKKLSPDPNLGPTRSQNVHTKAQNSYKDVTNWHPNLPRSKLFRMTKGAQDNMEQEVDCIKLRRLCQRKMQKTLRSQETLQTNIALQARKTWRCGSVAQAS